MCLSLFCFDLKFYVSTIVSCQGLSLGKRKEEKAGKDLSLSAGRVAEECQGGWMRGGNMYRVGKILQLDGRNANIEHSLSFPESDSGLFSVELCITHPVSSTLLNTQH